MDPIEFQIYDWNEDHEIDDNTDESDSETSNDLGTYIINTFGRTEKGESVYMCITNYTPHFYIKLPLNWTRIEANNKVIKMLSYFTSDFNKRIYKKYRSGLVNIDIVERMAAEGFNNGRMFLFARLIFNNMVVMKKYKYMLEAFDIYIPGVTSNSVRFKTYEANLPPMLRCFHLRKIKGCSWVSINKYTLIKDKLLKKSHCMIEIRVDWREIVPIEKDYNAPLRILSFDIECYTADKNKFPQASNSTDYIIQIGSTYTYLNQAEPYRQHIVCLRETDLIDGVIVESYETEREMVLAWIKEIINNDCDIITGYNIFGFDEAYIYDRCIAHLDLKDEILRISKLKNYQCNFKDFKLESSALGQNRLRLFETPGRIHIDLMKDIQKNHKLNSYKLDNVSSHFIRNEIYKIEKVNDMLKLYCDGIESIYNNDYIHIEYVLDFISDMIGYKYMIYELNKTEKTILIKGSDELFEYLNKEKYNEWCATDNRKDRKFKLYWSQAKDDVGPQDIFRMFNETSKERAIVAKYCIKDCRLINLLIDKLCVVTNNIEMSNVCYIPMSFLFTRGQIIKLFSLCLKYYKEAGYLFPVLKKPEGDTPSYEGAIVFDPEPNVEYEALVVKDYASLYPSSIIHKNMSHETIVSNDRYDNLPNIEYFNASFKDNNGTIQHRRFAKCNNELGIIPKILRTLIDERNIVKKAIKKTIDPFKQKILDGKQLALKLTANSLYGGLGAGVSPIFQYDIAACTTSTGREMLKLAKHFDENIVPGLLNGYKYALLNGDEEKANKILNLEMKDPNDDELRNKVKKYIMNDIKKLTFQPIIRYGDSVTSDTMVHIRHKNIITRMHINQVEEQFNAILKHITIKDKEYYKPIEKIETYSDMGWTTILYIMKHYTNKSIYEIETSSGSVKVTSDHSCILSNNKVVKPTELKIGDCLLTAKILLNNDKLDDIGKITNINIIDNYSDYVYDFETINHHFMAGTGKIVVHNTDSIFSCYRFRENVKQIKDTAALELWRETIMFAKRLLLHFIPNDYKSDMEEIFTQYYNIDKITDLSIPQGPKYKQPSSHYKIVPPIQERMEQFILHYMEESYMPWLWTIQDIFTKNYINSKVRDSIIMMKIFNTGINLVEKMNLTSDIIASVNVIKTKVDTDEDDEEINNIVIIDEIKMIVLEDIEYFMKKYLKNYIIQPYWDFNNMGEKIVRVRFYKNGTKIIDKRTLKLSIDMGVITGELVKKRLPYPHDLEYEKTFWPFLILTKKRYVGNKYEFNPDKYKQDYNGIVLKRRDNAPIVKEICGGIINRLIDSKDPEQARQYTIDCMKKMFNNEYHIKYFLTSKTLKMKEGYKDWTKIAHAVLADRISCRDPGNCPQSGDRIEFAAVQIPNMTKGTLQGERIETPQYIKDNNLQLDYQFYMTNQIMKPALQFLSLAISDANDIFEPFKIKKEKKVKTKKV